MKTYTLRPLRFTPTTTKKATERVQMTSRILLMTNSYRRWRLWWLLVWVGTSILVCINMQTHTIVRAHTCVLYIYIYHELLKKTNHTTIIVNHDTDDGDGDDGQQRRQSHSREHVSLTALGLHSFGLGMILSRRGTPWPMHELPTRTGPTRKIWSRLEGTRFNLLETLSREKLYKCRRSLFHIGISAPGAPSQLKPLRDLPKTLS